MNIFGLFDQKFHTSIIFQWEYLRKMWKESVKSDTVSLECEYFIYFLEYHSKHMVHDGDQNRYFWAKVSDVDFTVMLILQIDLDYHLNNKCNI